MKVYVIPTKGQPYLKETDGTLEALQNLVDGYIEPAAPVQLRDMGMEMLVNEEGLLRHLPFNENLFPFFYVGTAVLVGVDGESFTSLTIDQLSGANAFLAGCREGI